MTTSFTNSRKLNKYERDENPEQLCDEAASDLAPFSSRLKPITKKYKSKALSR